MTMMSTDQQSGFKLDQQSLCEVMMALRIEDGVDTDIILQNPLVTDILVNTQMSLMHLACHIGNERVVTALLEKGEDVNCKTGDGSAPIHILCSNAANVVPSLRILKALFQYNVDIDAKDSRGHTALLLACCNNLVPIVEALIPAGCSMSIPDDDNNTAFSISCRLATEGWYFWKADCLDDENGFLEQTSFPTSLICQALLRAGVNPNQGTVLPSAILYGSVDIVKEFLSLGMDVNAKDDNRRTPLGCACSTPLIPPSMVKLLLEHGADVHEAGGLKSKPIILAFVHNSVEKIRLLLSYGATLSPQEMSELVSVSLSKWFLENPEVIHEDSKELLSWRLLVSAGFRPQIDKVLCKLKKVYLCSSYSKVSKVIDDLLFPLNSLSAMCRRSIRSQISPSKDENIDHLPLPNKLKKFLKFDEFSSACDEL